MFGGGLEWFCGGLVWFGVFWGGLGCFNGPLVWYPASLCVRKDRVGEAGYQARESTCPSPLPQGVGGYSDIFIHTQARVFF